MLCAAYSLRHHLAPPTNSVAPVISLASDWGTLSCATGTWTGSPTFTYQWKRAGVSISGATASTYSTTGNDGSSHTDYGPAITCVVTATNGAGSANATSNALSYTPIDDGAAMWRDPSILTPGAVASYADRVGSWTGTQSTGSAKPTASATAINSTPGLSFDGGDILSGTFNASSWSVMAIIAALIDTTTGACVVYEHTDDVNATNGGFASYVNSAFAGDIEVATRGTAGAGVGRTDTSHGIATPKVITRIHTTANTNGTSAIRENGVGLTVTSVSTGCAAGAFANARHSIGARFGLTAPWTGVEGHVVYLPVGSATAAVLRAEQFVAWKTGLSPL